MCRVLQHVVNITGRENQQNLVDRSCLFDSKIVEDSRRRCYGELSERGINSRHNLNISLLGSPTPLLTQMPVSSHKYITQITQISQKHHTNITIISHKYHTYITQITQISHKYIFTWQPTPFLIQMPVSSSSAEKALRPQIAF